LRKFAPLLLLGALCAHGTGNEPLRSTLPNGLRVVIVRNTLASVVTVQMNFIVGGDETPDGFPGMAHAQEHMAFRGCEGMNADQTAAVYAQLGGDNNADTQQTVTQYYATVPAADLPVALEAQAACLRGIDDGEREWAEERGAIEQEVARDLSNPTYKFIDRVNRDLFAGTPYAHDPLGTRESFDATTGAMLQKFQRAWYAPNNAVLVIVGDLDPAATLVKVEHLFGSIPSRTLPTRTEIRLQAVRTESFTLGSDLPYVLAFIAYRLPGTHSADFAAVQILADALGNQRADLYGMVPAGQAIAAEFGMTEPYPTASVGFGLVALPAGGNAAEALRRMRKIIAGYAQMGMPADLIDAAKRAEIAAAEFERNSIPGLANAWSQALAAEGRLSPDDDIEAIKRVTAADVVRVARKYLTDGNSVTATLQPTPSGESVADKGFGGAERLTAAPSKPVVLPAWAAGPLAELKVPTSFMALSDSVLPNGIRLIVRSDATTPTVSVYGSVRHDPDLQSPAGKEGVADIMASLFSYGTQTMDRLAFHRALDAIAANESAGYSFQVAVLKDNFSRAVELLADNELHPGFTEKAFAVEKRQAAGFTAGNMRSPRYRTLRALDVALMPPGDPTLRQVTPATLGKVTLNDVRQFHAATIRPDLTTIVVIGDVSAEEARGVIERWFGAWRASGPLPNTTLPPVALNKAAALDVADSTAVQDSVILAEQVALNRLDPRYYSLELGNYVLGGGFYATRLYHDLRQVAGYVYTVDVRLDAEEKRANYAIAYGCDPKNVSKARALIERDLEQMRSQDVTPQELHQAKALILRGLQLDESSEQAVAQGLLERADMGLPLDEPLLAARKYYAIGAAEIRTAFSSLIRPGDLVQVVRGPRPH
jgi:zinc protease